MNASHESPETVTAEDVAQWLVQHNFRLTALEFWRELTLAEKRREQSSLSRSPGLQQSSERASVAAQPIADAAESSDIGELPHRVLSELEEFLDSGHAVVQPPSSPQARIAPIPATSSAAVSAANAASDLLLLRLLAERLPTLVVSVDPASREVLIPLLTMVALRHPAPSVRCTMLYQLITLYRRPSSEQIGSIVEGFEDWVARAPPGRVASEALPEIWNLTSQRYVEQRVLSVALLRVLFAHRAIELSSGVIPVVKDMLPSTCNDAKAAVRAEAAKVFAPLLVMLCNREARGAALPMPPAATSRMTEAATLSPPSAAARAAEEQLCSTAWTHAMNSLIALVADDSADVAVALRTEWAVLLQTLSGLRMASLQQAAATQSASPRGGGSCETTEASQSSLLGVLVSVTVRVVVQAMYEAVRSATTGRSPTTSTGAASAAAAPVLIPSTSCSESSRVLAALSLCTKLQRMLTEFLLATTSLVDDNGSCDDNDGGLEGGGGGGASIITDATAVELVEWLLAFVLNALPSAVAADAIPNNGSGTSGGGVGLLVGQLVVALGHDIALIALRSDPSALHALVHGCSDALAAPLQPEIDRAHEKAAVMAVERKRLGLAILVSALGMIPAPKRHRKVLVDAATPRRRDAAASPTVADAPDAVGAQSLAVLLHVLTVIARALRASETESNALLLRSPSVGTVSSPTVSKPSSAATAAVPADLPNSVLVALSSWEARCSHEWLGWVVKAVEHLGSYVVTSAPSVLRQAAAASALLRASTIWERGWDQFTAMDALWCCSASRDLVTRRLLSLALMRAILIGAKHAADRQAAAPAQFEPRVLVASCLWPQLTALIDDVDASVQVEAVALSVHMAMELLGNVPRLQVKILRSVYSFVEGVGPFSPLMENLLSCCREHFAKCSAEMVEEHLYDLVGGTVLLMTSTLAASAGNATESSEGARRWLPSVVAGLRYSRSSSRSAVDDTVPMRLTTMLNLLNRLLQAPVVTPRHVRAHLLAPVEGLCQQLDRNAPLIPNASAVSSSAHAVLRAVRAITDRNASQNPPSSQKTFLDKMRDEIKRIV